MLDGQEIHLAGDFIGTLEILIPDDVCTSTTFDSTDAITFYRSDGSTKKWTYAVVCAEAVSDGGQARYFITAKKDTISVCKGQCNTSTALVCVLVSDSQDDSGTVSGDTRFTVGGTENAASL